MSCCRFAVDCMKKKMRTLVCFYVVFGPIGNILTLFAASAESSMDKSRRVAQASFNPSHNHTAVRSSSAADDEDLFAFDLSQDDADIVHLAGLDIRAESEKLSEKMQQLRDEELRVASIQVSSHLCTFMWC